MLIVRTLRKYHLREIGICYLYRRLEWTSLCLPRDSLETWTIRRYATRSRMSPSITARTEWEPGSWSTITFTMWRITWTRYVFTAVLRNRRINGVYGVHAACNSGAYSFAMDFEDFCARMWHIEFHLMNL